MQQVQYLESKVKLLTTSQMKERAASKSDDHTVLNYERTDGNTHKKHTDK